MFTCDIFEKHYDRIKSNIKQLSVIAFISYAYFYFLYVFIIKTANFNIVIAKFTLTYLVMFIFIMFEKQILNCKWLDKSLNVLADYSFGIFFIHKYIINLIITGHLYESEFRSFYKPLVVANTFEAFFFSLIVFLSALFGSILILYILKLLITKLGIKNTRMFTGVSTLKK